MTGSPFTQAELFEVFSNARRRWAVRYLNQCGESCDLSSLVEQVAAWENETTRADVTRTQRRRVYISLYQTHLPMLKEHGIVDWDPEAHHIELVPSGETFEPYLDRDPVEPRPWHRYYLGSVLLGAAVFVGAGLSIGPLSAGFLEPITLGLCLVVLLLATTQYAFNRPRRFRPRYPADQ